VSGLYGQELNAHDATKRLLAEERAAHEATKRELEEARAWALAEADKAIGETLASEREVHESTRRAKAADYERLQEIIRGKDIEIDTLRHELSEARERLLSAEAALKEFERRLERVASIQ
jgi:hypothetical protein